MAFAVNVNIDRARRDQLAGGIDSLRPASPWPTAAIARPDANIGPVGARAVLTCHFWMTR